MSFDIFLTSLPGDETFDRSIVEQAFKNIATDLSGDYWNLQGPDGRMISASVSIADQPRISSFFVNRPPAFSYHPAFWDAMFEVLKATNTFLYWPAEPPDPVCCLAHPNLASRLPSDLLEALGEPRLVTCGREIAALIV